MRTTVTEQAGLLLVRIEEDEFEVNFETIEPTDVTLRFRRDGEKAGSIYNDDGTEKTMSNRSGSATQSRKHSPSSNPATRSSSPTRTS